MPCEVERFKPRPCIREDEFSERAAKLCQECWYNSINAQRRCGEVISNYKAVSPSTSELEREKAGRCRGIQKVNK